MVPLTRLLLLSGILSGLLTISIEGIPASYDQSQTGEVNVDAKLENFLFLVSTSFTDGLTHILTSETAQTLSNLLGRRSAMKQEPEKPSEATVYETEEKEEGREPYHVEIVRIEDGDVLTISEDPRTSNAEVTEVKIAGKTGEAAKTLKDAPEVSIGIALSKESRNQKSHKLIERSKKVNVEQEASKSVRPGISLKKQLSKKEESELLAWIKEQYELSDKRDQLGDKRDELVLLGDGVENCGPGRYRDKSGTCQEDVSLLSTDI